MESLGTILETVRILSVPIGRYFKYHRNVEKYMRVLCKHMEELNARREDIESRLNIELHSSKTLKKEVKLWLESVQQIAAEVDTIIQEVGQRKYFSRSHWGKKIGEKIKLVEELHQRGSFTNALVIDASPINKEALPLTELVGQSTAWRSTEEVWNCLVNDDSYRKIGVYGIGGVGKTTIIKYVHNQLMKENVMFDHVIWVSVSKSFSVTQLQDKIASSLGICIPENGSEMIRAAKLFGMMKMMRKYVLILDDVWNEFQLEDVGIPEPTADNESKLVLTTRSADVCLRMGCKSIKVEVLCEEEAWNLFVEKAGFAVTSPHIKPIAEEVAKQCACLPLAIVTIARSMKGVTESCEWRNALEELKDSTSGHHGMTKVLEQLKFSYNLLDDEKLQHCLLYCALYPEDFVIRRKELIELLIAGRVIDRLRSRQAAFDKGHAMLNKLEKACLLECVMAKNENDKQVKLHDLIRDMILQVTDIGQHSMVKAGLNLREIPDEDSWTEDLKMASLMHNCISEIPSNASPMCPRLLVLLLSSNHCLRSIPEPFFVHMDSLQVLDLSDTNIEMLPNFISKLERLTALLLRRCTSLRSVPSLEKLICLRKLDLYHTRIKEVPLGMEMLVHLRYLNLYATNLEFLPCELLGKLLNLQVLITYGASKTLKVKREEIEGLRKLEMFSGQFYDMHEFNRYVYSIKTSNREPEKYFIRVGELDRVTAEEEQESFGKHVKLANCFIGRGDDELVLPNGIQTLDIYDCRGVASLCDISPLKDATDLKSFEVTKCSEVRCLFNHVSLNTPYLRSLESLRLTDLENFTAICYKVGSATLLPGGTFSNLKSFIITRCPNIKTLFTPSLLLQLHNLSTLEVFLCPQMEEIITQDQETEDQQGSYIKSPMETIINHPTLSHLTLCQLPELKSMYEGILLCDSLQVIEVYGCSTLNRIPFCVSLLPSRLEKILATTEWWESLQWDHPNAKTAFQPFFKNCVPHRKRFSNRSI